ncbi:stalk domain-containing protein [Peptoniphilus vaginalis]|uniref:stalk domain-containing protein n=1 Tax=Peptoniphilus vaginalis TaxID=1756987 RepID=UPI0023F9DC14|nr:stalk domain-containing protein [Peptoniphilus vaginalis]
MKKLSKRIISLIITLAIIITILPSSIMAKELKENSQKTMRLNPKQEEPIINPRYEYYLKHKDEFKTGYVPPKYILPEIEKTSSIQRFRSRSFPSFYMTEEKLITPVKDQQRTGSCWAHAAISTIETLALKNKLSIGEELDLSEGHMVYNSVEGYDLQTGGSNSVALQYLTRLVGPVSEKNYPAYTIVGDGLRDSNIKAMADIKNKSHEYYIPRVYELKNTIENIKEQVQSEGSVANGYWSGEDQGYDKEDNSKYHYVKSGGEVNHQVTIVGWDDNIEITNKLGQSSKGAFRVKNSWGNNVGDKGYYWISYASFVEGNRDPLIVFKGVENKIDNLKNIYTYSDYKIPLGRIGYMEKSDIGGINLFERKDSDAEEIIKVTFYNPNVDPVRYKLFASQDKELIKINSGESNPFYNSNSRFIKVEKNSNTWEFLTEGEFTEKGFYTINLKTPYKLTNEKFALRIDLEDASFLGTTNNFATSGTSFINSTGSLGKEIYQECSNSDRYLHLNAITRAVSQPSLKIEGPEKSWEVTEGYDLAKLEPLVLKVVNDGNVRLSDMGFDLLGDDKDKFEIVNKEKDLYLPSLEKGKSLEVKIKPKEVLTLEDADKVFNLKLSVEAKGIEKPVTKDFTFKLKLDQKAREKEELEAEKNKLESAIKKAENLIKDDAISDTAKDLKREIDLASSILKGSTKISEVKEAIESLVSKTKAQDNFVKVKETLKDEINQLDDLSKDEKDGYLTQINEAKNQADIETIKKSAEDTNKNNKEAKQELEKAKSEAIEEIKAMKYLGNKKDDFIGKVETAKDKGSLAQVLAEAEKINKENEAIALEKAKEKEAEEAVNNLVTSGENASVEDIKEAQKLIDKLKDGSKKLELQDKLNDVVKLTELKAAKEKAIEAIKGLLKIEGEKQSFIDRVNKASKVEDVNSILEEAKNLSKERMTEEEKLNNAREVAITSINATNMPDLTNEEREGFENKIKSAETIDAVNAIVEKAQNKNNENHRVKAELAEKRTQAKATINGLPNIEKEKDGFISEIETAKDLASVESVVQRAKEKSDENTAKIKALEDAKIEAKGKISSGNMPDLTDEDRQGFEKEIEKATTIEVVNQVVANAKAKNQENKNAKETLNKAKADAVAEIEKMEFLDPTEKDDFKNQVNLAKDISEVENIQKAADAKNTEKKVEKEENDKIEKAKTALENLEKNENPSASEIQKVQGLIDLLKNGETKKDLQKRLDAIKVANELKLLKDDAIKVINSLESIEELKEGFIKEINESKDKNSVNEILNRANKKSQESTKLIEEKNKTVEKIKGLENLKEEERSGFLAELDTVTSLDSLKDLCLKANKKDANNLLNSKSLEDLKKDERKAAEKKIEEAETEEEIKTIIEKAKEQATINKEAAKSLADAKEAAIKLIGTDKMPELSSEERKGLEDRIEKATSLKEVKEIQAEASSINSSRVREKNLNKSKAETVRDLDNLNNLSISEIQTYKDKISSAGSSEEVERILEEAKHLDLINKNNKINEERERESRREDSKTHFWFNSFPKHQLEVEKTKVTPQAPILKQKEKVETKKFVYKFAIGKTKFTENNDGLNKTKELDVAPFIENGRTMLPLRAIAESIGIKVDWENSTRTAIFTNGDLVARIQIDGNKVILSDGRVLVLDAKPKIVKNRIVLPITNVSQIFGLTNGNTNDGMKNNIEWDNETKSVIISVNK